MNRKKTEVVTMEMISKEMDASNANLNKTGIVVKRLKAENPNAPENTYGDKSQNQNHKVLKIHKVLKNQVKIVLLKKPTLHLHLLHLFHVEMVF